MGIPVEDRGILAELKAINANLALIAASLAQIAALLKGPVPSDIEIQVGVTPATQTTPTPQS